MGGLASQLGRVTVSAVPDDESPEVGGLQNTASQFGASLGTALAGSLLIASLTASFLTGIDREPGRARRGRGAGERAAVGRRRVHLGRAAGDGAAEAGVDEATTAAIVDANQQARVDGLRATLALLAVFAHDRAVLHGAGPDRAAGRRAGAARAPA